MAIPLPDADPDRAIGPALPSGHPLAPLPASDRSCATDVMTSGAEISRPVRTGAVPTVTTGTTVTLTPPRRETSSCAPFRLFTTCPAEILGSATAPMARL